MDLTIGCRISLSKKLRKVLGKGGTLSLNTEELEDGKGYARLSLSSDLREQYTGIPKELIDETSIQITGFEILDEIPNNETIPQGAIFSTIPQKGREEPIIKKMAVVHPPERDEVPHAVVAKENIKTPEMFSQLDDPECREWISNMEDLVNMAKMSKSESSINIENAATDREKAVLMEAKEREEAIDIPAWIVNTEDAKLSINDMDISLDINAPYDLGSVSAKKIARSKDLRDSLKGGYIKFISPSEVAQYVEKSLNIAKSAGLEVFSSAEEAAEGMKTGANRAEIDEDNVMEVTASDMGSTSEEDMILNLTQDMSTERDTTIRSEPLPSGGRRSVHQRGLADNSSSGNPNVKPIRLL